MENSLHIWLAIRILVYASVAQRLARQAPIHTALILQHYLEIISSRMLHWAGQTRVLSVPPNSFVKVTAAISWKPASRVDVPEWVVAGPEPVSLRLQGTAGVVVRSYRYIALSAIAYKPYATATNRSGDGRNIMLAIPPDS